MKANTCLSWISPRMGDQPWGRVKSIDNLQKERKNDMNAKLLRVLVPALIGLGLIVIVVGVGLAQTAISQSGEVDLQLTGTVSTGTVDVEEEITVTLTVTNLHPSQPATGLFLRLYNLGGLMVELDVEGCQSLGRVTWMCDIPDLSPGKSWMVEYSARAEFQALLTGENRLHQYIVGSQTDSNTGNNLVDLTINVIDR